MKPLAIGFAIIGIIAVIGSLFFMFALVMIGSAASTIPPVEGVDTAAFTSSLRTMLAVGWIWSVVTLLAGIVSIRAGWREK